MGGSDSDRIKKARELAQFRQVLESWPDAFPAFLGEPRQPDEPAADIGLCLTDGSTYGIELTRLLRAEGQELAAAREKLVEDLWYWLRAKEPGVALNLVFAPVAQPRARDAFAQVAGLIEAHLLHFQNERKPLLIERGLPAFLTGLHLFPSSESPRPTYGGVFHVPALSRDSVAECIELKQIRLAGYRAHADAVALLIYCPMLTSQAQLAVPADASTWEFDIQGFERVVLYAQDSSGTGLAWQ